MGKKIKLPSILKRTMSPLTWPPFGHLKSSYSVLSDAAKFVSMLDSSWSQSKSIVSAIPKDSRGKEEEEAVVLEALKSKRLSFEPGTTTTSSILDNNGAFFPFQDSVKQTILSNNPYLDFRISMEEMVKDYGFEKKEVDLEYLEELLAWYLRVNYKEFHGCVIGAFMDMFVWLTHSRFNCFSSYPSSKSK